MTQDNQEFADFEVQVDLGEKVAAWGGDQRPLIPMGDYVGKIVFVKQGTIGQGTPAIVVTTEITEVADGGDAAQIGAKAYNNYPLTEAALGRIKQLQLAVGASLDAIRGSELMGAKYRFSITHSEGGGTPDANGNPRPAKTFANVCNEQPYEEAKAAPATKAAPPITRAATTAPTKPAATTARRQ